MTKSDPSAENGMKLLMAAEKARNKAAIVDLVESDYPKVVRIGAVMSLAAKFGQDARPELEAALSSENEDVRATAARKLYRWGDYESSLALAEHVDDPYDYVSCWCVAALPRI